MPPNRRKPLLSHSRPPYHFHPIITPKPVSSHATRALIRTHHTLQKRLSAALQVHDTALAASLQSQISAHGGLALYQCASLMGQSAERGGDSGMVLRAWVEEFLSRRGNHNANEQAGWMSRSGGGGKIRMLEVGALKVDNACSRSSRFEVERIDLHSQHPQIRTQDFMQRPLPSCAAERVDIISLSLVLNYVGDAASRGAMLRRVAEFLRPPTSFHNASCDNPSDHAATTAGMGGVTGAGGQDTPETESAILPALFLVLPASCVTNSRYLDEDRLEAMLQSLGYVKARRKMGAKLVYFLWTFKGGGKKKVLVNDGDAAKCNREDERTAAGAKHQFRKIELRPGGKRNNFAIVLA